MLWTENNELSTKKYKLSSRRQELAHHHTQKHGYRGEKKEKKKSMKLLYVEFGGQNSEITDNVTGEKHFLSRVTCWQNQPTF